MTNNFAHVCKDMLKFNEEGEFYLVLILKRRKDTKGAMAEGVNEDNRLIKHYFVYTQEYLLRKSDAIRNLCEQNNARAYILPQRRTCKQVMWSLHDKVSEMLKKNETAHVHFDHLIRSVVAGTHETPPGKKWQKRWVLDLDIDEVPPRLVTKMLAQCPERLEECTEEARRHRACLELGGLLYDKLTAIFSCKPEAKEFMPTVNENCRASDVVVLPTPHGWHIITPPFNRDSKACKQYFGEEWNPAWVKPDAMTILYAPDNIQ